MRYHVWISQLRTVDLEVDAASRDKAERNARIRLRAAGDDLGWLDSATIIKVAPSDSPTPMPHAVGSEPRKSFPVREAADILGIGRTTLYALINSGKLQSVSVGRRRFVARDQLERFVASEEAINRRTR